MYKDATITTYSVISKILYTRVYRGLRERENEREGVRERERERERERK